MNNIVTCHTTQYLNLEVPRLASTRIRTSNGKSLNDYLLIGTPFQRDLFSVCLRVRRHQFAFSADIEKMFRQIWVDEKDQDYQRIVWRLNPQEEIKHFKLKTVTYGTSSAPDLAFRCLKQLGKENIEKHNLAATIILNDFYMDDVMSDADTVEDLEFIYNELIEVLASATFNLRKWVTNCLPLLEKIPNQLREYSPLELQNDSTIKLLGLYWNPNSDTFGYNVNLPEHENIIRRFENF